MFLRLEVVQHTHTHISADAGTGTTYGLCSAAEPTKPSEADGDRRRLVS